MGSKASIVTDLKAATDQARELLRSDPRLAVRQARSLLKDRSDDPALLRLLAKGLRLLGDEAGARQTEAEAIAASTRSPLHREAAAAIKANRPDRATAILRSLLAADDEDVVALVMLGLQLSLSKDWTGGEALLRKAVELAPADPSARLALADHLQRSRRPADALEQLDALDDKAGASEGALTLKASALGSLGRQQEEVAILQRLIEQGSNPVRFRLRLGHALRGLGRTDEAIAAYRAITALQPAEGTAWWSLANLKAARFSDDDIATMKQALTAPGAATENRVRLHFALGKADEDRGEAEAAFHHYDEGNRLRRSIVRYDPDHVGQLVERNQALFTAGFFAERRGAGSTARDPIFIVGMQRSGSTLVEQILASHPDVEGTAELSDMPAVMRRLGEAAAKRQLRWDAYLPTLDSVELRAMGDSYLESTRVHRREDKPRFTDKLPNNWLHVGLIRTILPNARIVDVRRNPLACGFSNWKQLYAKGLDHSNALDTMGRYYADYVRLMRHFDEVQPGAVHRVIYERLVDDVEGETRRLLDYLGLEFDPAVLDFHRTERTVRTISATQVRRPINRDGLDRWRAFEQWLDPLKQGLGDALNRWDEE